MGGGKEKQKTNQQIAENRRVAMGEHQQFTQDLSNRLNQTDAQIAASRGSLDSALGGMSGRNYMVSPDFGEARGLYRNFASSGGIDENKMRVAHPIFQDIANNQDIQNRFRAGGTYEEFAKTGGVSAADAANLRSRGTSVIPAYYARMKAEADRANSLQGGYGPGAGALKSRLARDAAAASQSAALDTELGIADRIREGRMFGAQGMTGAEQALQGTRLGAGGALDASEANIQNSLQRGRMFGTSGIHGVSSEEAAIQAANMDRASGIDMGVLGMRSGLYNTDVGRQNALMGMGLSDRGLTYDVMQSGINQRMQNNPQRDWLGTILGAAGPIMTGVAGMPTFRRTPQTAR